MSHNPRRKTQQKKYHKEQEDLPAVPMVLKQCPNGTCLYLDASLALEAAVTCRSENGPDTSTLDKLFAAVLPELVSRGSRTDKLTRSDAALCRVYNQSTQFVPVQRLPHELLIRIFSLACERCGFFPSSQRKISNCQTTKTMVAITHVCTDWRRLAIDTPALWSHVDILDSYRDSLGQEQVWLERARSVPLSVQANIDTNSKKLTLLGPHFGAIRSLGFESDSSEALGEAFVYWVSNGTPGSVQELSLLGPKKINFGDAPRVDKMVDLDLFMSFVKSLKVLRLRHVEFNRFARYVKPVHLELSFVHSNTFSFVALIGSWLWKCPELRVLKLEEVYLSDRTKDSTLTAELDKLERLEIIDVHPDPCSYLLPGLVPGARELSLRLETEVDSGNEDKLVSFLYRSNVTKLYFKLRQLWNVRLDWMTAARNLRMLVLDFPRESKRDSCNSILETLISSETSTSRFPKLRTLWVIEFNLDIEVLKRFVETFRIETLIISVYPYLDTHSMKKELGPLLKKLIMEYVLPNSVIAKWYSRTY
ncbi:hypothetical protein FRC06_008445 [Ceratobasidium sp. 370]|nr:hypothetical protein FRC06_008445 [Ceratobasidium sp. 370]